MIKNIKHSTHLITLIAAIVLIAALSYEVISGAGRQFSSGYMSLQLAVCSIFLIDLGVRLATTPANSKLNHVGNLLFLLVAIPWHNILDWAEVDLTRHQAMGVAVIPLIRAFLALYIVVHKLIEGKVKRLFWAYTLTVILFTYLSALIFYDFESGVNSRLSGFGNALWWAWMNVTTVGAAIFPVTTVGKILCVMLPILGMAMFPIFTVYVTSLYTHKSKSGKG